MIAYRYQPKMQAQWDEFVVCSRNGTFLFNRRYMDYHRDRFSDHSLMLHDGGGRLVAILPANEADGVLHSHAGLTYGGFVVGAKSGSGAALAMLEAVRSYMRDNGLSRLVYKTIPWIYHRQPTEEDRYALFRAGAALVRRDVLSVAPREERLPYQERRSRGVKSAAKAGVQVKESQDYAAFWGILEENLLVRHGVKPVHTLLEIELLQRCFPSSIRLFLASVDDAPVAGAVIYESAQVAHVQYISTSETGKAVHALDAVFDHLLKDVYRDKRYFDFGISNENAGRVLNSGLVEQKEGFGARTVAHDYYELEV